MVDLLPRFQEMGHEVHLCLFNGKRTPFYEELEQGGVKIVPLSIGKSVYHFSNFIKLTRLLKKERYDIVHTHNTACQLYAALAAVLCSVLLCTTEHNTSNRRRDWKWYVPIDKWMYRKYKHIVCISDATETNLRKFIGESGTKISTIYNGIDVEKYKKAQPINRMSITSHPNRIIIAMVAGFRCQKDHETVIKAAHLLPDNYEIWFIGDGKRRPIIESLITKLRLEDKVILLGGRTDVSSILKAADIVVMSSHWEGFGLAAVEGMAAGKPVIASNVDGLSQVVGGAGILFSQGDYEELSEKIQYLAINEEYRASIIDQCIKRACQYDIATMSNRYNSIYQYIVND